MDTSFIAETNITTKTLEKLRIHLNYYLNRRYLLDPQLELYFDDIGNQIVLKIRDYVWAEPETKDIEFKYPETIWEYFKEKYAPYWFKRRYPVRYKVFRSNVKLVYPEFKNIMPNHRTNLVVEGWREVE